MAVVTSFKRPLDAFSDLFAGFMHYATQNIPRTFNDNMEPPYRILELLAVHSLPKST